MNLIKPNLLRELENFIVSIALVDLFTMNNKKQPPEVFYKKAVLKNFSTFAGKHLCYRVSFLINIVAGLQLKPIFIQKEAPGLQFS